MTKDEVIKRLEQAIFDFKECTETDERSSVIQLLIEDLEANQPPTTGKTE